MNNGVLFLHLSPFHSYPPTLVPIHPSARLMLPLMLNLVGAPSIRDGPFSFMRRRRPICSPWLYEEVGEERAAPRAAALR